MEDAGKNDRIIHQHDTTDERRENERKTNNSFHGVLHDAYAYYSNHLTKLDMCYSTVFTPSSRSRDICSAAPQCHLLLHRETSIFISCIKDVFLSDFPCCRCSWSG